jgi:hypothetical protein
MIFRKVWLEVGHCPCSNFPNSWLWAEEPLSLMSALNQFIWDPSPLSYWLLVAWSEFLHSN